MTFFLRYKCRIQWYVEACARAPDCQSAAFFPSSSPVTKRSVLEFTSADNPNTFPFRKKQLRAARAHLRFLRSEPSRSEELLGSGRGCSSLLKICHLKWLKKIQFLPTRRGFGMNDAALCLCPCRLCGPHVACSGRKSWDGIILIGLRYIRISQGKAKNRIAPERRMWLLLLSNSLPQPIQSVPYAPLPGHTHKHTRSHTGRFIYTSFSDASVFSSRYHFPQRYQCLYFVPFLIAINENMQLYADIPTLHTITRTVNKCITATNEALLQILQTQSEWS